MAVLLECLTLGFTLREGALLLVFKDGLALLLIDCMKLLRGPFPPRFIVTLLSLAPPGAGFGAGICNLLDDPPVFPGRSLRSVINSWKVFIAMSLSFIYHHTLGTVKLSLENSNLSISLVAFLPVIATKPSGVVASYVPPRSTNIFID